MAILEYSGTRSRNLIGFLEEEPPEEAKRALAESGGYQVRRVEAAELSDPGTLATLAAVVLRQTPAKRYKVVRDLETFASRLLCHDCRVFVQPWPAKAGFHVDLLRKIVVDALKTLNLPPSRLNDAEAATFPVHLAGVGIPPFTPWIHVLGPADNWSDVAVHLRNNPPSAPPHFDIDIVATGADGKKVSFTSEQDLLLRRAFADCAKLRLVGLPNGLSKVDTFRAFAELRVNTVGGHTPFWYFVKIGARAKVATEYWAYRYKALEKIPFHLGPRLRQERCALGHTQGLIVGDFVRGAESLRECARDGRAVPVIANLFNETLRAWQHGWTEENRSLCEYLVETTAPTIPEWREPLVRKYGATMSPAELQALVARHDSRPVRVGTVHGDLHATNVLVRNQDAIVIDFEKMAEGAPLLCDMASLEGGLFVDGFIGDRRTGKKLLLSVSCLYEAATFREPSQMKCHPADGSAWFFECVHQIRLHARHVERAPCQYALALAVALYKKACNPDDFRGDAKKRTGLRREDVRALAFVLAERILVGLRSASSTADRTP
ncbi:MAG: phosphotransferase [Proteobacteria bacterium]|nr:phosphotransferase [Pseudomonadota bacterium]